MKFNIIKKSVLVFVGCLPFIAFAQKSQLNENFEKYSQTAPQKSVESTSLEMWKSANTLVNVIVNPQKSGINTSNQVLQIKRAATPEIVTGGEGKFSPGANTYKGCTTNSFGLNLTETLCVIEFKVLKKATGRVGVRIHPDATSREYVEEVSPLIQGSDAWQLVRLDFSRKIPATGSNSYLLFEVEKVGTSESQSPELTVYLDDVKITTK
jgi:hypothetical protein